MRGEKLISEEHWDDIADHSARDGRHIGYECPLRWTGCEHVFDAFREEVVQHLEDHHNVAPDGVYLVYECFICEWASPRRSEVAEHVRDEHPERLGDPRQVDDVGEREEWHPWEDR